MRNIRSRPEQLSWPVNLQWQTDLPQSTHISVRTVMVVLSFGWFVTQHYFGSFSCSLHIRFVPFSFHSSCPDSCKAEALARVKRMVVLTYTGGKPSWSKINRKANMRCERHSVYSHGWRNVCLEKDQEKSRRKEQRKELGMNIWITWTWEAFRPEQRWELR